MNAKMETTAMLVLLMSLAIAGCGSGQSLGPSHTSQPAPPTSTPYPVGPTPTPQPIPPTFTPAPPTASPTPGIPTYSDVLKTYPTGVPISCTDLRVSKVTPDGNWTFGGRTCGCVEQHSEFFRCYGAKLTIIENSVTIDGKAYPPGTKLTVNNDLNWIEVSSWN